ncbi:SusD/RagB family nutrient-binding outer membrane lipoprotein [Pedobacter nutrimenti]|jgi:hypothetical protein|uniref:SusD/RagB-like outer membrane lipoprotein n=1 Tax=Pedobacter nutrimenti TaxID=1241337 RepID=A0A318UP51_9SPHI|nr:SusD/RagB family nutrient-binding outer membrane lipoprotein [Pedobacter nutrimenti]PYF75865.1 SusD/RagB-like outer membrane lipoprotein [Pedobacter nutrimenti]
MKNIFKNKIIGLCLLFFALSCKKLDINESPNNPPLGAATVEVLFPAAVMSTVAMSNGELAIVCGLWAQFWTQSNGASQYRTIDAYSLSNSAPYINTPYAELYSGALNDYQLAAQKAVTANDWSYNLMITVMRAYTFEVLVDLFDRVPYTEALQSATILQPKFDDGYTVYKGLIAEIDAALSKDFRKGSHSASQIKTDFVFGGHGNANFADQMDNWEKFANTLKLKMYLRMVNAKPSEAEAGIRGLYQKGAQFLNLGAGLNVFVDAPDKGNPFFEFEGRRLNFNNLRASYTLTSWLSKNSDPRASAFFGAANPVPSIHQGDYLIGNNAAATPVIKATDPAWLISEAESYFMQAEALERYFGGAGAKALYDKAVTTAFAQVGLAPGALITAGGAYEYPSSGTLDQKIEAIIVQKWASLFGSHALEAFFEQNRTGYPKISPVYSKDPAYVPGQLVYSPNGATGAGNFPRRFVFPDVEKSRNTNTPAEAPIYTKVWWGK